jgi:osmotically inducible lipoprotein OsmB
MYHVSHDCDDTASVGPLAGSGYSRGDRAVSGGLIGAGAGAAVGAVTGGSPLTGALIGGGIVGGAVTSHNDVNLGRPVWR